MKVFSNGLNPGDVAGFDAEIAARMIARGEAAPLESPRQMPVATAEQKMVVEKSAPVEPIAARDQFRRNRR